METPVIINNLATKWCAKYPGQGARIVYGSMLALSGKVTPRGLSSWRVEGAEVYAVEITCGYPSCDCAELKTALTRCSHMWAVALLTALAAELVPPVKARKALPKKKPVTLDSVTARHHAENHARLLALPLAKVIPIR